MKSKKKLVLVPSAYNPQVMGDIEGFIPIYKDTFEVYVITSEKYDGGEIIVDGVHYVRKGTKMANYLIATADYIIDAGTLTGTNRICSSQKRISVWHGTPYKSMFVDLGREHIVTALDYSLGYDLMVSPSPWYSKRFLRESMLYDGEILETSVSRTDSLFISPERAHEVKHALGIPEGKKVLLYAPTFREKGEFALPFSPKRIQKALGDDWVIVVKLHYLNTIDNAKGIIDATEYPLINNLLAICDLLISDYSSLVFDYSVLAKPCLLYQYDREEYERERSFMFSMEDYVASVDILSSEDDLCLRLSEFNHIGDNLVKVRKNFYPHQGPNATERLVKELNLDAEQRDVPEVIFLVNQLNQIGGVHTFATNLARQFKERFGAKTILIGNTEFDYTKDNAYVFDPDNLFDVKVSAETDLKTASSIVRRTDGYIISCQYGAHRKLQRFMKDRKAILMFHGDTKDVVSRTYYSVHLDGYNNGQVKNFRRLALLTKGNCEVLKSHLKPELQDTTIYIENGMDFSDAESLYEASGHFALVSRLDDDKNPMEAIELFASKDLNSFAHLDIYGDGSLRPEIEARILDLGLSDRITLHGYESDIRKIYGGKQGVLSVSLTEGLPLTILEATKFGIPVYAYDSFTSCADLIDDHTGIRIPTGDRDAFVAALNNPFDMACFDNSKTIKRFSNDAVVAKWKALFDELDEEVAKEEAEKAMLSEGAGLKPASQNTAKTNAKRKEKTTLSHKIKETIQHSPIFDGNERYAELSVAWRNIKHPAAVSNLPLVSVIMPYYNNADTVRHAVRSVAKCGYPNYEIVLVNDGWDEDPMPLLKRFHNIRYFYKENGGLSSARNFGVEQAKGKYLLYLDSDDIIFPRSLEKLVTYAENHDLEMVCGKTIRYYCQLKKDEVWYPEIYQSSFECTPLNRYRIVDDTIATGKLYKRDALLNSGVKFETGNYEDILYTGELYAQLDRIGVVASRTQKWMVYGTGTTITTSNTLANAKARLKNVDKVFKLHNGVTKIYLTRQYIRQHMVAALNGYINFSEDERKELFELFSQGLDMRKPYIVGKLIPVPSKKALYESVLERDFSRFDLIATGYSERYFSFHKAEK